MEQIKRFVWLAGLSNNSQTKRHVAPHCALYEANVSIGENDDHDDTPVVRFIEALLRRLIPGCSAEDTKTQYSSRQSSSSFSCPKSSRGSLQHDAFRPHQLSQYKNTTVLVQVAIVLGKFAHSEDLVAIEEGVQSLTDILRVLMQLTSCKGIPGRCGVHSLLRFKSSRLSPNPVFLELVRRLAMRG